jgi:spore coat polysaccharide biosynthesis predicted glycosyltransferase SpsG/RimJ/RimL family protein N-acetyltransferase
MRLLLRCDGGPGIGVGHLVRSLALAEEAVARGHEVSLLGRVGGGFVDGLVAHLGPGLTLLGPDDGAGRLVAAALTHDVVHLDHYGLPSTVAADIASAAHAADATAPLVSSVADGAYGVQEADVVVDPTVGAERRRSVARARWHLRGGRFVALRGAVVHAEPAARASERLAVVVVMGGTDAGGCAPAVLEALAASGVGMDVTVVATPGTRERLDALAAAWTDGTVTVSDPRPDLPALLAGADVVVSAAGTTAWELCALGRPMAVIAVVDNQGPGHDVLVEAGAAVGLGGPDSLADPVALAARLRPLLTDADLRSSLADRTHALVDGRGAWRLVRMLEEALTAGAERTAATVGVRPAGLEDADLLLSWRNDPTTRAVSRTTAEVPRAEHVAWLTATLARSGRHLLVVLDGDEPVGTVRWDDEGAGEWEVSITVAPSARGRGLAGPALTAAQDWLAGHLPAPPSALLAVVHEDNTASRRLFLRAGYAPDLPPDDAGFERWVRTAG